MVDESETASTMNTLPTGLYAYYPQYLAAARGMQPFLRIKDIYNCTCTMYSLRTFSICSHSPHTKNGGYFNFLSA